MSERMSGLRSAPIPKRYKPWIILSIVVLVGSLMLLAVAVTGGMILLGASTTPLWVIACGVLGVGGIGLGFAGFFGLMAVAGWQTWREGRKVQVISPERNPIP